MFDCAVHWRIVWAAVICAGLCGSVIVCRTSGDKRRGSGGGWEALSVLILISGLRPLMCSFFVSSKFRRKYFKFDDFSTHSFCVNFVILCCANVSNN